MHGECAKLFPHLRPEGDSSQKNHPPGQVLRALAAMEFDAFVASVASTAVAVRIGIEGVGGLGAAGLGAEGFLNGAFHGALHCNGDHKSPFQIQPYEHGNHGWQEQKT